MEKNGKQPEEKREEALRGGARVAAEVVEVFEPWVKK
jgi:NTP pyrophosphatase (non-canonical NTP hydrolase)